MKVDTELLAPAGNVENFFAALQAGADAVYVGAPGINARNLSRDLRLEEIGAMIRHAHSLDKKVYIAANSIILEDELPSIIETLACLEALSPDALIVQDLALMRLVQEYFPKLSLHASTLMGAHNSDNVQLFADMGCERVVLARELTLKEIEAILRKTDVELEIFVHGAMCYSYSGLCLFSSFLGGKSGMRGRCVQPCRRDYGWQGHGKGSGKRGGQSGGGGGYIFSMNDLEAFEAVPQLKKMQVASLKIEGRLRSANYVRKIVQAYRLVLDADESELDRAIAEAKLLAEEAMGRKTSSGYFLSPQPQEAIVPHHSGNMGIHLGRFSRITHEKGKSFGFIKLKREVHCGDRLRLHREASGERKGFTLHFLRQSGVEKDSCSPGSAVKIGLPDGLAAIGKSKVELYKVDDRSSAIGQPLPEKEMEEVTRLLTAVRKDQRKKITSLQKMISSPLVDGEQSHIIIPEKKGKQFTKNKRRIIQKTSLECWLKTDSPKLVLGKLPFATDVLLLSMDKQLISQAGRIKKYLGKGSRNVVWALPPVILENDIVRQRKQVHTLIRSGFKGFQLGHIGQLALFGRERVHLYGNYTLNLANSQALAFAGRAGLQGVQLAIEMDRKALQRFVDGYRALEARLREQDPLQKIRVGLTVYGAPPLFTSRLSPGHFQFNRNLVSPKGESFSLNKNDRATTTVSVKPFSLLPYLEELQEIGLDYIVIDLTNMRAGERELKEVAERLSGSGKYSKLPTFNYLGKLE